MFIIDTSKYIKAFYLKYLGLGLDMPLLDWLKKYTYPVEKSLSDTHLARQVYNAAVNATLNSGTTCAAYFATIHRESCEILCDVVEEINQRALVGKVCSFLFHILLIIRT